MQRCRYKGFKNDEISQMPDELLADLNEAVYRKRSGFKHLLHLVRAPFDQS